MLTRFLATYKHCAQSLIHQYKTTNECASLAKCLCKTNKKILQKPCSKKLSETSPLVNRWGCVFEDAVERQALPLCLWIGWRDDSPRISPQPYKVVE